MKALTPPVNARSPVPVAQSCPATFIFAAPPPSPTLSNAVTTVAIITTHCITAADNDNRSAIRGLDRRLRYSDRPFVKGRLFKHAHWSIPDDGLRVPQSIGAVVHGFHANIHAGMARVRKLDGNGFRRDLA